jgi:hypothetical protein
MTRLALTLAVAAAAVAPAAAGDSLAETLHAKAPAVLQKLRNGGFTSVGVLKFTLPPGDDTAADGLNELGNVLAVRTQKALVLANKNAEFTLLENPNKEVANLSAANHLNEAGRKPFFTRKYQPAVGKDEVAADGFVVGTALPAKDRSTLTLKLHVFDKQGKQTDLTGEWAVDYDPELLGVAGETFVVPKKVRKAVVSGEPLKKELVQKLVVETAVALVKAPPAEDAKPAANPALDDCPVKWEIRYNDKVQAVSGGRVAEPDEGDKVSFVLHNTSKDETFGVVLLVNGESTLYQEKQAVARCRKWILEPGVETVVSGFQTGPDKAAEFKVVRPDDPDADGVRYSENLGLFRLVVFAGKLADADPDPPTGKPLSELAAIGNARLNDRPDGLRPQSLAALKAALTSTGPDTSNARGVVVPGGNRESKTAHVWFAPASDTPVADITLRYFHPKK